MARSRSATDPRTVALRLLDAVLHHQKPLDEALADERSFARLSPRDRAFARNLASTTIRRLGQIDAVIDACLDRPLKPRLTALRDLLRLGVCQIAFLRTPPHAAVDATVSLAQGPRLAGYRGLANAVLRRVVREADALLAGQDAARLNTPDWLWQSWTQAYGEAKARAIAMVHLEEPPLDLTVKAEPALWAEKLGAHLLPTGSLRLPPGSREIARLPGFEAGAWWVQDAAAALPARLLGDVAGKSVVDLCAAPGGKTAQLAAAHAEVIAVERAPNRLKRLESNLQRLGLSAATVLADAADWRPPQPVDAVLLDAPCSATGTLRRHPDIARLKDASQIAALTALQDRLLDNAVAMLRPGGVLVYATCSLQPEEGPRRIDALLARLQERNEAGLLREPVAAAEVGGLAELIGDRGDLRSLPCHLSGVGGLDGFYACRLRRL